MSDFGVVTVDDRHDRRMNDAVAMVTAAAARLAALRALHWQTADQACVECAQRWPCKTIRIVTGQP